MVIFDGTYVLYVWMHSVQCVRCVGCVGWVGWVVCCMYAIRSLLGCIRIL